LDALKSTDPETYEAIVAEEQRQRDKLLLIASPIRAAPRTRQPSAASRARRIAGAPPRHRRREVGAVRAAASH
jgi:glycine hydroxymethyltransferase